MSSDEAALQVDLAEFNALRAEIQTFITLQSAFLGLAIAVVAAGMTVAVGPLPEMRPWMLAASPLTFAILAILYADVVARIGRAARYIEHEIQPRLARQTWPHRALGWEHYVHKVDPSKELLKRTDEIRYAIFFLPAVVTYCLSYFWPVRAWWNVVFWIVNPIALLGAFTVKRLAGGVVKEIASKPKH
jgi:hypothetical protein